MRNKWTNEEIEYLKANYPTNESQGCIELLKNHTLKSISAKARRIGLKSNKFNSWSKEEDKLLIDAWKFDSMKQLLSKFPNRTYDSILQRATKFLKVKSEVNRLRKGSFKFLDNLNPKSCYWWGFIIADGHLSIKNGLYIGISINDKDHIEILANHINKNLYYRKTINSFNNKISEMCILNMGDKNFAEKWLKILNINSPKTYTPPDLSIFLNKENLIYFLIGFIDGDGCIWKSKNWVNLRIELHINWLNTLNLLSKKIKKFYNIESKVKVTKKKTAKLEINTKKDLLIFKNYLKDIEFMTRKWSKLDLITWEL